MFPEPIRPAAERALQAVFGAAPPAEATFLTGGLSGAQVWRVAVAGRPYLLRVGAMGEPAHEFACMRAAADAGLAPRVLYTDAGDRTMIADFVPHHPFPADAGPRLARTFARLHAVPAFPATVDYFGFIDAGVRRFAAAGLLPPDLTAAVVRAHDEARAAYDPDPADLVASHNDPKPQNMVFDGERFWLIDWETAFRNDRHVDLAIVANFWADGAEDAFLEAYWGEPAGPVRRARFDAVRRLVDVSYVVTFLSLAARGGAAIDPDAAVPGFADFHRRVASGAFTYGGAEARAQYGLVLLNRVLGR